MLSAKHEHAKAERPGNPGLAERYRRQQAGTPRVEFCFSAQAVVPRPVASQPLTFSFHA